MKVLWFTNSPSLAKQKLNQITYGGGWMESMQESLENIQDIELAVSFYSGKETQPFRLKNSQYFPLQYSKKKTVLGRYLSRISHQIENEKQEVNKYLSTVQIFNPDLIHIFGTEFPFGLLCNKVNIPTLIWIQGNITVCTKKWFTGISGYDIKKQSFTINKWKGYGLSHSYPRMLKISDREKQIFSRCKYFLGRTDFDKRITRILAPTSKYYHCDEILRKPFYLHEWKKKKKKNIKIISVLNANIYKGFETIYEAKSYLAKAWLNKVEWHIVGCRGNEEIIRIIEKKFKYSAQELEIIYKGKLFAADLVGEFLSSDIFIHTSHIENSPNSVCEAMILGLPIIATNVGGVSSLLESRKEGLLIQDGDPIALAGAIIELLENYDFAVQMGKNARKKALIRHNPDTIMNQLLDIYKSLINKNRYESV